MLKAVISLLFSADQQLSVVFPVAFFFFFGREGDVTVVTAVPACWWLCFHMCVPLLVCMGHALTVAGACHYVHGACTD